MPVNAPIERRADIGGVELEILECGAGPPLLFLHPGYPSGRLDSKAPVLGMLAKSARVIAPTHPGFGEAPAPRHLTSIDDLAYLYLDLLDAMNLRNVVLAGVSLGGWIAAEMAVKSTERISSLVLANAVGIRPGARDTREIADIYAVTDKELAGLVYADPVAMAADSKTLPESELKFMARSRESTGRYAWSPYMHDPKLLSRLHRVKVPALVLWGAADRVVSADYGRAYAKAIPGAKFVEIAGAGHFPHLERPGEFAAKIAEFANEAVA
jgi:pimeloyl-ACP methyl ester carboxylesterase